MSTSYSNDVSFFAYICRLTQKIMKDPVLGLCSHLFDMKWIDRNYHCPIDEMPLIQKNIIPLPELQKRIQSWNESQGLTQGVKNLKLEEKEEEKSIPSPFLKQIIKNVHADDIHGMILLSDQHQFITGSKDTTLKKWDDQGKLLQTIYPTVQKNYDHWITALAALPNSLWASGTRDGMISIWGQNGEKIRSWNYYLPHKIKNAAICKDRNRLRINCITPLGEKHIYTGTPRFLQLWDRVNGKLTKFWHADQNDWVYCVEPLENQDLLVVIGSRFEHWDMQNQTNPKKTQLIQEEKNENPRQRPHISAIVRLEKEPTHIGCALFDGSVRVINYPTQSIVQKWDEHKGRVWSVINLDPNVLASSADDKKIKIWDVRMEKSAVTLPDQMGRVSSLLKLNQNTLVSGCCPDDIKNSAEKASLSFWELRQSSKKE